MLTLSNINKSFGQLHVLHDVSLHVSAREVVTIMGPSGAGKSTLLQIIGTLDRPDSGTALIDGTDILSLRGDRAAKFRNRQIGFVFQFHQLLPEFTAEENVMMPALIGGASMAEARRGARRLLDYLGLADRLNHRPAQLSGGEQQRVAVARALINKPALLLADEPSGSLDSRNRDELHRLFFSLRDEMGQTVIIVTHDEHLASLSDRTIHLIDGKIGRL